MSDRMFVNVTTGLLLVGLLEGISWMDAVAMDAMQ